MSLPLLAASVLVVLAAGYALYGRMIASRLGLDPLRPTPARTREDGVDFVPTPRFYLLGQHFSAIAAAGPIVGPILACREWGWLPCVLWIGIGVVFVGAVHDLVALFASVRHGAGSLAEIARRTLGPRAWVALTAFVWVSLVYVIVAFTDATASNFVGRVEEIPGQVPFQKGGAVAAAAVLYLALALVMGLVQRRWKPPTWVLAAVFVPATLGLVYLATDPWISNLLLLDARTWFVLILAYCVVGSFAPVWALLQPRGFLGGFVLYLALAVGVVGVFFGGFEVRQPAIATPAGGFGKDLFPFLFVTIACGACSGFHGLVCGGTTSKQLSDEGHCRPVGYGAMLLEAFVALIALSTILVLAPSEAAGKPPSVVYSHGIASFLTVIVGPHAWEFATVFAGMAFSTFVFDTLDVAMRLARYLLSELFGAKGKAVGLAGTLLTAGVVLWILFAGGAAAFSKNWLLFGSANQLLAGLTLLSVSVWLRAAGRPYWFTLVPGVFVLGITAWSLSAHAIAGLSALSREGLSTDGINGLVAIALLALSATFVVEAIRAVRRPVAASAPAAGDSA